MDNPFSDLSILKDQGMFQLLFNPMRRVYQTSITVSIISLVSGDYNYKCDASLVTLVVRAGDVSHDATTICKTNFLTVCDAYALDLLIPSNLI